MSKLLSVFDEGSNNADMQKVRLGLLLEAVFRIEKIRYKREQKRIFLTALKGVSGCDEPH